MVSFLAVKTSPIKGTTSSLIASLYRRICFKGKFEFFKEEKIDVHPCAVIFIKSDRHSFSNVFERTSPETNAAALALPIGLLYISRTFNAATGDDKASDTTCQSSSLTSSPLHINSQLIIEVDAFYGLTLRYSIKKGLPLSGQNTRKGAIIVAAQEFVVVDGYFFDGFILTYVSTH
ncbi:hypothetical protein ACHAW6_006236 [Cyclotella cf. meneghiniana]